MMLYVLFGGNDRDDLGADQSRPACCCGATFMALAVLYPVSFHPEELFTKAVEIHSSHGEIMAPGGLSRTRFRHLGRYGADLVTAGLPHILMRASSPCRARRSAQVGRLATTGLATSTS